MARIHTKDLDFNYYFFPALSRKLLNINSKRKKVEALRGINLDVQEGDRVALFGRNGAGKSTLLRVLAGTLPHSAGELDVTGKIYSFFGRNIGVNVMLSGYENLYIRGLLLDLPDEVINAKMAEIAEFTELGDSLERPVSTYSAGMRARLTFGMLMFVDADVLLVDEGLGAGDKFFIDKARAFVDQLLDNSKILIFASHAEHLLKRFCNKALLLEHGRMVEYGDFDKVRKIYDQMSD